MLVDVQNTFSITINGKPQRGSAGQTIFAAAQAAAVDIPTLCSDPRTKPTGSCGICVVEVAGTTGLQRACNTLLQPDMSIVTDSPIIRAARKEVLDGFLSDHNAYCQPPCQYACPAGIDVAGYIDLIAQKQYVEATALIKERLPLPGVLGRVCPRPCESVCRRTQIDGEPVAICSLKRFAADKAAESGGSTHPDIAPATGKKVAVVGGGPAGLSAAYYLALEGHSVTILESQEKAGGMLRYGIPPYRLPKDILDQEIGDIVDLGVELKTSQALGHEYTIEGLRASGYDAVFLGIGASIGKPARIPGEDAPGVLSAVDFLARVNRGTRVEIGERIIVIGGGFTAADAARTSRRLGAGSVTMMYRRSREEMPASEHEIHDAEIEGVSLDLLSAPVAVVVENGRSIGITSQRMQLGEPDDSGRRRPEPIPGSEYFTPADTILLAIGQDVDVEGTGESIETTRWNSISVDEGTMATSIDGVFSGGDCATGAATVVEAVAGGRRGAWAINAYLNGKTQREIAGILTEDKPDLFDIGASARTSQSRADMPVLADNVRLSAFGTDVSPGDIGAESASGAFSEVETGFSDEAGQAEAERCLQCRCQAAGTCSLQKHSIEYGAGTKEFIGRKAFHPVLKAHPFFEMNREKCISCLNCVRVCNEIQFRKVYMVGDDGYPALVGGTDNYADTECNNCGQCVSACPTGALKDITDTGQILSSKRRKTQTTCVYCGVGCAVNLETEGDRIVAVSHSFASEANNGGTCVKGRFGLDFVNHPERLTKPLMRRAGKDSPLEEAEWDEAIAFVASRLNQIKEEFGADAIGGLNSAKATNEDNYIFQKFMRTAVGTNNVDHCARLCHIASAVALGEALGSSAPSASTRDIGHSDGFLIVGSNTTETHPVISSSVLKAKYDLGAKIVVIDPRRIEMVEHADVWLRPYPGTNTALLNGLCNVLITEGMLDQKFIEERTEGFDELMTTVAPYTPEYVSGITGVPADRILEAARIYGNAARGMILWGMGITQHVSGVNGAFGLANLALLSGHIGRPGTGLMPLRGQNNVQGASDMGLPTALPGYQNVHDPDVRAKFEDAWAIGLPSTKGMTVIDMEHGALTGTVKALYVQGENPMLSSPDISEVEQGLRNLDLLVVQDIFLSQTAQLADVVFPVASFAEKAGTFTNTERRVQLVRSAIPPVGESRVDWQVICAVSTAMGYPMEYESAAEIMEELAALTPQYAGIRHDRLEGDGIMWPCPDTSHPGTRVLYAESFPRGRGRFTCIEQNGKGEELSEDFPLLLSTGRLLQHYHTGTMSRRSSGLDGHTPDARIELNPEDARRLQISEGEVVRVVTKRGKVEVAVRISERSPEGLIFLPFHFSESPANRLTSSVTDKKSNTPGYKRSAARIEKIC